MGVFPHLRWPDDAPRLLPGSTADTCYQPALQPLRVPGLFFKPPPLHTSLHVSLLDEPASSTSPPPHPRRPRAQTSHYRYTQYRPPLIRGCHLKANSSDGSGIPSDRRLSYQGASTEWHQLTHRRHPQQYRRGRIYKRPPDCLLPFNCDALQPSPPTHVTQPPTSTCDGLTHFFSPHRHRRRYQNRTRAPPAHQLRLNSQVGPTNVD
ncbi:uncharacterized protein PGTG_07420 [Puccinia graminis f. sp. tritici CRL 75-36-700-3]|uniref:Uncharacterized protein n=1 Tax=Puccinia graminis f. sp. tritici (strain CRL 75-36-700-3 / race SCCL) TaxID=418459 RepID=E3K9Y9_PUCGT|nr:uncharacterized protein PGTG_07420 [Puccinia graminis f. sp. tritici CRL 75-36-700-3]EFP81168.2 hypothetical protein PGTG_07420 [Puccinia graminis f. sp. tritici CRL 75-36-700-3]